jgi:hypothetical protein
MKDFRPHARRVPLEALEIEKDGSRLRFEAPGGSLRKLGAWIIGLWGGFERLLGRYSFLAMFATAFLVGLIPTKTLFWAADRIPSLGDFIAEYWFWAFALMPVMQLGILIRLFTRELPKLMDNAYRHLNRADNLRSLRRTSL